jgi:hypothetical protein
VVAPSNAKVSLQITEVFEHAAQGFDCGAAVLPSFSMIRCAAPSACPSPAIFRISPPGARLARACPQSHGTLSSASNHLARCGAQAGLHSFRPPPQLA